ncbi:hypothetical protein OJAV_G00201440 [Oryzias javanicus]|uniref:Chemokine interleukin-8-like domain-containing protein n=1 Tax=Oryzias javanicus TaxID=123683 RepID=A0A3S2P799_ORYJA|nr:hypothetical protein OJAV_G00201440 [Oryzias javanicus]
MTTHEPPSSDARSICRSSFSSRLNSTMSLSASQKFLLSLAAVIVLVALQVPAGEPFSLGQICCETENFYMRLPPARVTKCYEQTPRPNCQVHAFVVLDSKKGIRCMNPKSPWLKKQMKEKRFVCHRQRKRTLKRRRTC